MTDEPANSNSPVRPQGAPKLGGGFSGGGSPSTPRSSSLTQGDPTRRAFGDKTDAPSKKTDLSKANDKNAKSDSPRLGAQTDEDGGEYDKGPRADATQKGSETNVRESDRNTSGKVPEGKSDRTKSSGSSPM